MKDQLRSSIESILDNKIRENANKKKQQDENAADRQASLVEFYNVCSALIEPSMREIGDVLKSKGFDFRINIVKDDSNSSYGPANTIIFHIITDKENARLTEYPRFSITYDPSSKDVQFHGSTIVPGRGGRSTSGGSMPLVDLTADVVQSKIAEILGSVFR